MTYGEIASSRRKELGLTQNDVALSLGYTAQAISKFEKGLSDFNIYILPSLCDILKIDLDSYINGQISPKKDDAPHFKAELFGAELKSQREDAHLSIEELAKKAGSSKRSIINYEKGDSYPSFNLFHSLCQVLNSLPSSFFVPVTEKAIVTQNIPQSEPSSIAPEVPSSNKKHWAFAGTIGVIVVAIGISVGSFFLLSNKSDAKGGNQESSSGSSLLGNSQSSSSSSIDASSSSSGSSSSSSIISSSSPSSSSSSSIISSSSPSSSSAPSSSSSSSSSQPPVVINRECVIRCSDDDGVLSTGDSCELTASFDDLDTSNGIGWLLDAEAEGVTLVVNQDDKSKATLNIDETAGKGQEVGVTASVIVDGYIYQAKTAYLIDNPSGDLSSFFPGLTGLYIVSDQGGVSATVSANSDITLRASFVGSSFVFDENKYQFQWGSSSITGLSLTSSETYNSRLISVGDVLSGTVYSFNYRIGRNDTNEHWVNSNTFTLTIA